MTNDSNGWEKWKNHVIMELTRLNNSYECLTKKIDEIKEDIITLKVKSGIWGLFGGGISVLITIAIYLIIKLTER